MALVQFEDLPSTDTAIDADNLNNNFNELKPYILYQNTSGTTDNFEISDNRSNYKFLEVHFGNSNYYRNIIRTWSEEAYIPLMTFYNSTNNMQLQTCQMIIRGTSVQRANDTYINCNTSTGEVACGRSSSPLIKVFRVIGYKD